MQDALGSIPNATRNPVKMPGMVVCAHGQRSEAEEGGQAGGSLGYKVSSELGWDVE